MADCVEFSGSPEKWGDGVVGRRIGPVGAALSKTWGDGFLSVVKVSEPLGISSTQGHLIKVQILSPPAPPIPRSVLRNPVRTAFPLSQLEQKAVL